MCPAHPQHIKRRVVLSEDYHDEKVTIDFYTNSAIAIYRGDEDHPETERVWLDNLEKHALLEALSEELDQESDDRPTNHDEWSMRMSNSPNLGPIELLRRGWRRFRGRDDD